MSGECARGPALCPPPHTLLFGALHLVILD